MASFRQQQPNNQMIVLIFLWENAILAIRPFPLQSVPKKNVPIFAQIELSTITGPEQESTITSTAFYPPVPILIR